MPGPAIKFTPPDAANLASHLPEPLRKAGGMALQGLMDVFGADDPMSGVYPTPLVAHGGPSNIPALKAAGKAMVEKIRAHGLEQRSFGIRPNTTVVSKIPAPNTPVPEPLMQALEFAQQKYPRLFGHITDLADVDALTKIVNLGSNVRGSVRSAAGATPKLSKMALSPELATPRTVGHELLHVADRITRPDFDKAYGYSMGLPGGYGSSAYEIRANNAGDSMALKMLKKQQPKSPTPSPPSVPPIVREDPAWLSLMKQSWNGWTGK